MFLLNKKKGNIIRINDIFKNFKPRVKKKIRPIGFVLNSEEIYVATNLGKLLIISIENGNLNEIIKIGKKKISRPFVENKSLFLIKSNSIVKLD